MTKILMFLNFKKKFFSKNDQNFNVFYFKKKFFSKNDQNFNVFKFQKKI